MHFAHPLAIVAVGAFHRQEVLPIGNVAPRPSSLSDSASPIAKKKTPRERGADSSQDLGRLRSTFLCSEPSMPDRGVGRKTVPYRSARFTDWGPKTCPCPKSIYPDPRGPHNRVILPNIPEGRGWSSLACDCPLRQSPLYEPRASRTQRGAPSILIGCDARCREWTEQISNGPSCHRPTRGGPSLCPIPGLVLVGQHGVAGVTAVALELRVVEVGVGRQRLGPHKAHALVAGRAIRWMGWRSRGGLSVRHLLPPAVQVTLAV